MKKLFSFPTAYKTVVCICLVILLITGMIVSNTLSNNGEYLVQETHIQNDGYTLTGTLYVPKVALEKDGQPTIHHAGLNVNKVPAVITQGGGSANRYIQEAHIVEVVKRGIAVFAIDAYTHGESDEYTAGWNSYSHVNDAVEYVHTLDFVDKTQVGYWGHSQGGNAAMLAMLGHAGYFTYEDLLFNVLHDELGVEITADEVAAQDPDAVAAGLGDYEKGYYESRKNEITDEFYDGRISFGVIEGLTSGGGVYIANLDLIPDVGPKLVEVGGVPVMRNMQANILTTLATGDDAFGQTGAIANVGVAGAHEYPISDAARALCGTGDDAVELGMLYSVNRSDTEETVLSTKLGQFDAENIKNPQVVEAAANKTLRLLVMFPGWHNTNHYNHIDISTIANFISLATGYNNGYVAETGGAGAVAFEDTNTWKLNHGANTVAFYTLLVLAAALAAVLLGEKQFEKALCPAVPAPQTKKSPMTWISAVVSVLLPVLLITPLMMNSWVKSSWFFKFDRINPIVSWSLSCAIILLIIIVIKWHVYDKKNTKLSFRELYGLTGDIKSIAVTFVGMLLTWFIIIVLIFIYGAYFNGANFITALPKLNMPVQLTVISAERYLDWFFYFLYFLPFWIIGGMLQTSGRMHDMPDWLYTIIQMVLNFVPFASFCYITYNGYIATGGTVAVLGLNWATAIQMLGIGIALPMSVLFQRMLYKRTNSCLPGAMLSSMIFTLPFICTVIGYTVASMPVK